MIVLNRLSENALYLSSKCAGKGQTLRVKCSHGPRDINYAQQLTVVWMPNRGSRTSPNANFAAEMLHSVDLYRFQRGNGGSDRVCPNVCLPPTSALFKVAQVPKIDRARISRSLKDKSRWVCENDHRVRFGKKKARLAQRRPSRLHKSRMSRIALKEFWLKRKRRLFAFDRYPMILRTLPRFSNDSSQPYWYGAVLNKALPRPSN